MLKMEIEFDKQKISAEGIVTEVMLFEQIDRAIMATDLIKVCDGVYRDRGDKEDLTKFIAIISYLSNTKWFPRYVKRWNWYNDRHEQIKGVKPEDLREIIYMRKGDK